MNSHICFKYRVCQIIKSVLLKYPFTTVRVYDRYRLASCGRVHVYVHSGVDMRTFPEKAIVPIAIHPSSRTASDGIRSFHGGSGCVSEDSRAGARVATQAPDALHSQCQTLPEISAARIPRCSILCSREQREYTQH